MRSRKYGQAPEKGLIWRPCAAVIRPGAGGAFRPIDRFGGLAVTGFISAGNVAAEWLMSGVRLVEPLTGDDPREVAGYQLRARLGAGGMGRVYLASTPGGRRVALKVVRAEFGDDEQFRARFRQEVAAAQRSCRAGLPGAGTPAVTVPPPPMGRRHRPRAPVRGQRMAPGGRRLPRSRGSPRPRRQAGRRAGGRGRPVVGDGRSRTYRLDRQRRRPADPHAARRGTGSAQDGPPAAPGAAKKLSARVDSPYPAFQDGRSSR